MTPTGAIQVQRSVVDPAGGTAHTDTTSAVADFFSENRPRLEGFARKYASDILDPQDLLADALTSAIAQASNGKTIANIGAYLFTAMRNRIKDELRSPRSRVVPLWDESIPHDGQAYRDVELLQEKALVGRALNSLPADQQRALLHVVVAGDRARELTTELGRPASAIYSLVYRAKIGLRRALLKETLLTGEPTGACVAFADALPDIFPLAVSEATAMDAFTHLRVCDRCTLAWARFSAIPDSLESN